MRAAYLIDECIGESERRERKAVLLLIEMAFEAAGSGAEIENKRRCLDARVVEPNAAGRKFVAIDAGGRFGDVAIEVRGDIFAGDASSN